MIALALPLFWILSSMAAPARAGAPSWDLVGLYDATALMRLVPKDKPVVPTEFVWEARPGMTASCGPEKSPDGLGLMEAEAMANGLSPTLAILLERHTNRGASKPLELERLDSRHVWVTLQSSTKKPVRLRPAVEPRRLRIDVQGRGAQGATQPPAFGAPEPDPSLDPSALPGDSKRVLQLVRTQLEMELCMEHKTGRAWFGGLRDQLKEAFLLKTRGKTPDCMFFHGQAAPVSAMIGPPDACFHGKKTTVARTETEQAPGAGRLDIVPADVWGSSIRDCKGSDLDSDETQFPSEKGRAGRARAEKPEASSSIPLSVGLDRRELVRDELHWRDLLLDLSLARDDLNTTFELSWGPDGEKLVEDKRLFVSKEADGTRHMQDILAHVPAFYPTFGDQTEAHRYTVLLVPNWQIVQALSDQCTSGQKAEVRDGVGWVLAHPEALKVQIDARLTARSELGRAEPGASEPEAIKLPNVAARFSGRSWPFLNWGYSTGLLNGRKPIVLLSDHSPSWQQNSQAQRAWLNSLFLACFALVGIFGVAGLRRLRDLWTRAPEERVAYWPGKAEPEGDIPKPPLGGEELAE